MHHVGILYDQFMMHGQRNIKLYVLHKLKVKVESPILCKIQHGTERNVKNLKSLKFNQNIEILKQHFKILSYEDVWEFLTPNILIFSRDDLLSDI